MHAELSAEPPAARSTPVDTVPRDARPAGWRGRLAAAWPRLKRLLIAGFFLLVAVLLVNYGRHVDWRAVRAVLQAYSGGTLALAAACGAASYALYCSYDLLARRHVGHELPCPQVAAVGFVSYAFNLNLGSLVGGVGLRYRLYSRLGLALDTITQVLAFSVVSNWLGYLVLAGGVFVFFPLALPPGWALDSTGLRWVGALLMLLAVAYVGLCFARGRRRITLRGRSFAVPSGPTALLQLALSCTNWMLIAGVITLLMNGRLDYVSALSVLLIAAVAGVVAHIPAGLGVLEAVFVALLVHRVPQPELLAALIAYRAVYYIAPLGLALAVFLFLERRGTARSPGQ